MKGNLREVSFTEDTESYVNWVSEIGVCFLRCAAYVEHGGTLLSYGPSCLNEFYEVLERHADALQRVSFSVRPCWGLVGLVCRDF